MAAPLDALIGMGLAPSPYFEALAELAVLRTLLFEISRDPAFHELRIWVQLEIEKEACENKDA
jgi:hypothetical protein